MIAVACRVDVRFKSTFSSVESCLRSGAGLRDCGPVVVVRLPFLGFTPSLFCPTSDSKLEAQRHQVTRGENPPHLRVLILGPRPAMQLAAHTHTMLPSTQNGDSQVSHSVSLALFLARAVEAHPSIAVSVSFPVSSSGTAEHSFQSSSAEAKGSGGSVQIR